MGEAMSHIDEILQKIESYCARYETLAKLITAPEIIAHNSYWRKLVKEQKSLAGIYSKRQELANKIKEKQLCIDILKGSAESEYEELIKKEIAFIEQDIQNIYQDILTLIAKEKIVYSDGALINFKAKGEGAYKFCKIIFEMYKRFCTAKGFDCQESIVNYLGGIKEGELRIVGQDAYHLLGTESAMHRKVDTLAKKQANVLVVVVPLQIKESPEISDNDLKIDVFHASGAGGQNVNKVETAVRIRHLPTNIVVTCQDERSQLKNKERALQMLRDKVQESFLVEEEKQKATARKNVEKGIKVNNISRIYDFISNTLTDSRVSYSKKLEDALNGSLDDLINNIKIFASEKD